MLACWYIHSNTTGSNITDTDGCCITKLWGAFHKWVTKCFFNRQNMNKSQIYVWYEILFWVAAIEIYYNDVILMSQSTDSVFPVFSAICQVLNKILSYEKNKQLQQANLFIHQKLVFRCSAFHPNSFKHLCYLSTNFWVHGAKKQHWLWPCHSCSATLSRPGENLMPLTVL